MPIGITFDETMAGAFALGPSDPEQGAEAGNANGITLTMNASVKVPDLDKFIAEPTHQGSLTGSINFPPLGEEIKAKSGIFNLFSPSGEPNLRYMVYELAFMVGTDPYYLAGKKHVRDDFGFDLWSDTTTLFTTLHKGKDASSTIVGAGVLRLDMGDFLQLMSTIKVTGTKSKAAQAAAVAKFGSFFMGELWDIYGPEL